MRWSRWGDLVIKPGDRSRVHGLNEALTNRVISRHANLRPRGCAEDVAVVAAPDEARQFAGGSPALFGTTFHEALEVDRGVLAAEQHAPFGRRLVAGKRRVLADPVERVRRLAQAVLVRKTLSLSSFPRARQSWLNRRHLLPGAIDVDGDPRLVHGGV